MGKIPYETMEDGLKNADAYPKCYSVSKFSTFSQPDTALIGDLHCFWPKTVYEAADGKVAVVELYNASGSNEKTSKFFSFALEREAYVRLYHRTGLKVRNEGRCVVQCSDDFVYTGFDLSVDGGGLIYDPAVCRKRVTEKELEEALPSIFTYLNSTYVEGLSHLSVIQPDTFDGAPKIEKVGPRAFRSEFGIKETSIYEKYKDTAPISFYADTIGSKLKELGIHAELNILDKGFVPNNSPVGRNLPNIRRAVYEIRFEEDKNGKT